MKSRRNKNKGMLQIAPRDAAPATYTTPSGFVSTPAVREREWLKKEEVRTESRDVANQVYTERSGAQERTIEEMRKLLYDIHDKVSDQQQATAQSILLIHGDPSTGTEGSILRGERVAAETRREVREEIAAFRAEAKADIAEQNKKIADVLTNQNTITGIATAIDARLRAPTTDKDGKPGPSLYRKAWKWTVRGLATGGSAAFSYFGWNHVTIAGTKHFFAELIKIFHHKG